MTSTGGLLVQGITGRQGTLETGWMQKSGVRVSCGVTPGRGGLEVHGVPVFDTVAEAVEHTGARVSMCYAPARLVPDAVVEAAEARIAVCVVSAENVPLHGFLRARERAAELGTVLIGPNSQGVMIPGVRRWGCPGGDDPWERFAPGEVAVVSRSGGMASEISVSLRQWGMGTSVQIATGGSTYVGLSLAAAAKLVQRDPHTRAVIAFGEPSGAHEYELARAIAGSDIDIPVVVMVPGRATASMSDAVPFGHASAARVAIETSEGKLAALAEAGARVARSMDEIHQHLKEVVGS